MRKFRRQESIVSEWLAVQELKIERLAGRVERLEDHIEEAAQGLHRLLGIDDPTSD